MKPVERTPQMQILELKYKKPIGVVIKAALVQTHGSSHAAAKLLGIHFTSFYRWLQRLGIEHSG